MRMCWCYGNKCTVVLETLCVKPHSEGLGWRGGASKTKSKLLAYTLFYLFILSFVFFFFRAAPIAYGGSQARGLIGAAATCLHHIIAMRDLSYVCDLHHSS